ncbi:MAG: hypothetical protein ACI4L5_06625 [Negativibacillus sp.]
MTTVLEQILTRKTETSSQEALSAGEVIAMLRQLEQQIRDNDALFNLMTEGDLIEACIYDGKALRSRYRYYHNMARRMGLRAGDR